MMNWKDSDMELDTSAVQHSDPPPAIAANTAACFTTFLGQRLLGVLEVPIHSRASAHKTLVFEDGRGLSLGANAFWVDPPSVVREEIAAQLAQVEKTTHDLAGLRPLVEEP